MKNITMTQVAQELHYTELIAVVTNNDGFQWIDTYPNFDKRYEKSPFVSPVYIDRLDNLREKMHEIAVFRNLALLECERNQFENIVLGL